MDANGDGNLDIAIANYDSPTSLMFGRGDGTFAARQDFTIGYTPSAVAAADVNRDGHPDLVVGTSGSIVDRESH